VDFRLYKIKVSGKVQGVYYRQSTKVFALEIGIKGWVKNQDDGSVLIHAEGREDQLKALLIWCQQGSPASKVEKVEVLEVTIGTGFETFYIEK
jgi:acylphosphatase